MFNIHRTFERSWQLGKDDWKKANISPIFKKDKKDRSNYWLVSLVSNPGKVTEQIILETNSKHMKDKQSSQYEFLKGILCLTNLVAFNDEIMSLVDKGRAVDGPASDKTHHVLQVDTQTQTHRSVQWS